MLNKGKGTKTETGRKIPLPALRRGDFKKASNHNPGLTLAQNGRANYFFLSHLPLYYMLKHYIKFLVTAVLLTNLAPTAFAQKNFRPGYVVHASGDTVRGEIDARGWQRMAHICLFRPSRGAEAVRYAPAEPKAFAFEEGARYEACQMPASVAAGTSGLLFLQVLAQGKAMLYGYTDEDGLFRYFFRVGSGGVVELIQTTQTVVSAGSTGLLVQEKNFCLFGRC